jgi:type II secretory pathway component GspD/PulD (secretin)
VEGVGPDLGGDMKADWKTLMIGAALIAGLTAMTRSAYAYEAKWPAGPYKYVVINQEIRDLLIEFGHNIGVPVKVSDQVREQRVTGPLASDNAEIFFNRLCETYGLIWYFDGSVLHVSAESELKTDMINLGRFLRGDLAVRKLEKLGVSDVRYPIRPTADAHIISVSGPPPYRTLVRQEIIAMAKAAETGVLVIRGGRAGS